MGEELLGKIIVIIFIVALLITDWKDIWSMGEVIKKCFRDTDV
ncbi:hypothetical protein ES705_08078 [subsurface metagenome]